MIPVPSSDEVREVLRAHLEGLVRDTAGPNHPATAEAVTSAVSQYLADQRLSPPLPDDYLHMMIYRSLRSLREDEAAAAWAVEHLPAMGPLPVFDPEIWPGPVPMLVWQLFTSGLVKPTRTLTADGQLLWILDFQRLQKEESGWMELTLLPGLRALLEQLAPAWDETGGRGLLGLRGLMAAGFAPTPRRKRRQRSAYAPLDGAAIRSFCLRVFAYLQKERGWRYVPEVLYLDLAHHTR